MSNEDPHDLIFKALANPARRAILDALTGDPKTTGTLCGLFPQMDRCTVMQHLAVLERAGLVVARKVGRERWNHLNALPIKEISDRWIGQHAARAMDMLARLQGDV